MAAMNQQSEDVRAMLARMSPAQKVGQMVMVDFSGHTISPEWRAHLAEHQWGGVILFARNVASRAQVAALCTEAQAAAHEAGGVAPLFVGIDQEGGIVNRMAFPDTPISPGNMAIGATDRTEHAFEAARLCGLDLASLGINLNFAPCADVNNNPFNPIIGVRSFGENAETVTRLAVAAARGYRAAGVIPTAKHFPGHGDTEADSHLEMPVMKAARDRLDRVELAPFRALINDGLEMIMTAHIVYPALETRADVPATLSESILTGVLRRDLGYQGVIVTDSMAMQAVARHFGVGQAAVMAVRAGADIVMACGSVEAQRETVAALLAAVAHGDLTEHRLDDAVGRILALKAAYLHRETPSSPGTVAQQVLRDMALASITLVKDEAGLVPLKLPPGGILLVVAPERLPTSQLGELEIPLPLADLLRARGISVKSLTFSLQDATVDATAVAAAAATCDAVLACLYARDRLAAGQVAMARALAAPQRPLGVIALNSPYVLMDLPWVRTYLCTYGYARPSVEALADILTGAAAPTGRLPVTIPGLFPVGHGIFRPHL